MSVFKFFTLHQICHMVSEVYAVHMWENILKSLLSLLECRL